MKPSCFLTLGLLASSLAAPAQFKFDFAFNSGSTGTTALNITTGTNVLDLPPDGILHYTTINVAPGATLRFNRNPANTPVYLLASGDVTIAGIIDVSGFSPTNARMGGLGGPGGFDGGFPAFNSLSPGDGFGPGGGKAGGRSVQISCHGDRDSAGYGSYSTTPTSQYGSTNGGVQYGSPLLVPLIGGSGGGGTSGSPGLGGGGGGGAILIASSTRIDVSGTIRANGGRGVTAANANCNESNSDINPGSGGAIRIVAPVVAGSGTLRATGSINGGVEASHGRIRIDSIDRRYFSFPGASIGTYMVTFPPSRLDIIEVGGTNIVEGSGPVAIQLPTNSDTNVTVKLQARNFNAVVTNLVVLTPENGPRTAYTNIIDNTITNVPATGTITVGLPVNTIVTINAWTR